MDVSSCCGLAQMKYLRQAVASTLHVFSSDKAVLSVELNNAWTSRGLASPTSLAHRTSCVHCHTIPDGPPPHPPTLSPGGLFAERSPPNTAAKQMDRLRQMSTSHINATFRCPCRFAHRRRTTTSSTSGVPLQPRRPSCKEAPASRALATRAKCHGQPIQTDFCATKAILEECVY